MASFSIGSETHNTCSDIKWLFEFLSDFKNFHRILPEDKVENFQYTEDECSFNIKGITPMRIKMAEKKPFEYILFTSEGLGKFNFNLKVLFSGEPDTGGTCRIDLNGDLNPFILSMAQKPLTALVNTMADRLSKLK